MIKPKRTRFICLAASSLLACSGLAVAQQSPSAKPASVQTKTEAVSVQTTTLSDGKNIVEVRVVDGQVFVKVNGEQRPTRSLDGDWAKFEVRSKDGEAVIATVLKNDKSNGVIVHSGSPSDEEIREYRAILTDTEDDDISVWVERFGGLSETDFPGGQDMESLMEGFSSFEFGDEMSVELLREIERSMGNSGFPMTIRLDPSTQPKSMIGITMNLERNEDGEFVIVEEVMEGLPAANAGLRSGDRIIEIEQIGKADEANIRRITREFEPGQEVTLRIIRDGDEIEKVITLAPYRNNIFGTIAPQGFGGQRFFAIEPDAQRLAELRGAAERLEAEIAVRREQIEAIAQKMASTDNPEELAAKLRESALQLEQSIRRLSEQRAREGVERGMLEHLRAEDGGGVIVGRTQRGDRPLVLTIPGVPLPPSPPAVPGLRGAPEAEAMAPNPETQRRIDSLEQRLDRLEESNQRIERMLEALMAQMAQRG